MTYPDWFDLHRYVQDLEEKGVVTRTFRRLDPPRQEAVIQSILMEAAEKGPAELSMKAVAERAGVAVGSLYQYFGSRENLLAFATALVTGSLVDMLQISRPYLLEMPFQEALYAYIASGVEYSQELAGPLLFFARAAYHGESEFSESVVRPVADAMRALLRDLLEQAQQRGEIRPDVDVEAASRILHALSIALGDPQLLPFLNTYFQVTGSDLPPPRLYTAFLDLIMRGLGQPTPAPSETKE